MEKSILRQSGIGLVTMLLLALVLAGCGGGEPEPTTTPVVAAVAEATNTPVVEATEAPEVEAVQTDSPLAAPESPRAQPDSPLELPDAEFGTQPLNDMNLIARMLEEQTVPPAAPGKASISGVLYSYSTNAVIRSTVFYLTPAIEDNGTYISPSLYMGPKEENGDVASTTDDYGRFAIDNVPPGVYYLAVWAPYDWILAFESQDAPMPLQIQLEEGEEIDFGMLWVSWPNGG